MRVFIFLLMLSAKAFAFSDDEMANQYFSKKVLSLSADEKKALEISKKWQLGNTSSKPFYNKDGSVRYVYGYGQTQIVCAVLQICSISLEPGEVVSGKRIGDPRFTVEEAVSGADNQVTLDIKPMDVGLDTTLNVYTDRRKYNFRLKSTRNRFMPVISFIYPENELAKEEKLAMSRIQQIKRNTIQPTGENLEDLDFGYEIEGNADWKPLRAYNNKVKTIIEMPKEMSQGTAPALLVLKDEGGVFSEDKHAMVNYRVQGNRYIVDNIFDKAVLITGVGSDQVKVTISRSRE